MLNYFLFYFCEEYNDNFLESHVYMLRYCACVGKSRNLGSLRIQRLTRATKTA